MIKITFNQLQIKQLETNPNVLHVTERSISYHPEFKVKAVIENLNGKGPSQIFVEHNFDLAVIGSDKPKECLKRWRRTFQQYGEEGLRYNRRGIGSAGRSSTKEQSLEEKLKKLKHVSSFWKLRTTS